MFNNNFILTTNYSCCHYIVINDIGITRKGGDHVTLEKPCTGIVDD